MDGVNAYKDGVVSRLYKGLQGLVKSRKITYVEGEGRLRPRRRSRWTASATRAGTSCWPPAPTPRSLPGLEIDGTAGHHQRPRAEPRPGAGVGDRPRRRRHRLRVRQRLEVLRRRRHHRRGAAAPRAARGRARPPSCWSARSASARSRFELGQPVLRRREHRERRQGLAGERQEIEAELLLVAVGRGPVSQGLGYEEAGRRDGPRLRPRRRATAAPTCPTISAVGDLIPTLQLAHVGFGEGILVAERLAGLEPAPDRLRRRPPRHLLRPRGRLGRHHRGPGQGEVRRRRSRP